MAVGVLALVGTRKGLFLLGGMTTAVAGGWTAEDLQEEQEHVQGVQEDRRGQQRRGGDVRIGPHSLEVNRVNPAKITRPSTA
jgi:hypothetical protein